MSGSTDYYRVLGVLPDAEQIVITAAYRALASMYHPDRWTGDKNQATRRMSEINVAYGVLGDPTQRAEYDKKRQSTTTSMDEGEDSTDHAFDSAMNELEDRWQIAASVVPDLQTIRRNLEKTAHRLAFAFVVIMLESKKFQDRQRIAEQLEKKFLETHFGTNQKIIAFAKLLIQLGRRDAIKALNKYVDVLGSELDAALIIGKVTSDFSIDIYISEQKKSARISELKTDVIQYGYLDSAIKLAQESQFVVEETGGGIFTNSRYSLYTKVDFGISKGKKILDQCSAADFISWVKINLC